MPRFKSIITRIVFLHVVAVVITSILMSLALSWLLNYATKNIHDKAMQEQAVAVGEYLSKTSDGRLELKLPSDLLGLYSQAYGRYSYAVVDAAGRLVGLITSETIGEMLMIYEALPKGVRFGPWSRPAG